MNCKIFIVTITVLTSLIGGCGFKRDKAPATNQPTLSSELVAYRKVKQENYELKDKIRLLSARIDELENREQHLSQKLRLTNFSNTQYKKQVDALATAPAQRDIYKLRCDELTKQVEQLQKTLAQNQTRQAASNVK